MTKAGIAEPSMGKNEMVRVGIVFGFDESWLGGINYFRNLLNAVYHDPGRRIQIVILTGTSVADTKLQGFPSIQVVRSCLLDSASIAWRVRRLFKRIFRRDFLLEALLLRHEIGVLSHSGWLGRKSPITTLGWIPDFQILRLPQFFSHREKIALSTEFEQMTRYCTHLIVSSADALADLHRYFPESVGKSTVLRFAVTPEYKRNLLSIAELECKYGYSGRYFLLPNQFWAHKNHRVVIDALAELKRQGRQVLVLATGNTQDYRQPGYFDDLQDYICERGVEQFFRVLGMVPLADLNALMRNAIATINPSLFEGWSTTVEEAKMLGKPVVLSDIAVHREQNPPGALYFAPQDHDTLTVHLWELWHQQDATDYIEMDKVARLAEQRFTDFSRVYQQLVVELVLARPSSNTPKRR